MNDPSIELISRPWSLVVMMGNVVCFTSGCIVQHLAGLWFDETFLGLFFTYGSIWMMLAPLAMATLFCSWGPGPLWIRSLLLIAVVIAGSLLSALVIAIVDTVLHGLAFYVDFPNTVQVVAIIAIPLMLFLTLFAALGRWRIGPPSMNPIRIRIVDVMLGTMAFAIQFAMSSRIGLDYTLIVSAVVAPIVAVLVTLCAWSLRSRVAFFLLLAIWSTALIYGVWNNPPEVALSIVAVLAASLLAVGLIAISVSLLSKAGWPLSRRVSKPRLAEKEPAAIPTPAL